MNQTSQGIAKAAEGRSKTLARCSGLLRRSSIPEFECFGWAGGGGKRKSDLIPTRGGVVEHKMRVYCLNDGSIFA